jgi:hypothetical protein
MVAAPRYWFCALACMVIVPSTSTAAVKVIVSFRTKPSSCSQGCRNEEKHATAPSLYASLCSRLMITGAASGRRADLGCMDALTQA